MKLFLFATLLTASAFALFIKDATGTDKPSREALRGAARVPSFIEGATNTSYYTDTCSSKDACANSYRDCCGIQTCNCHLQDGTGKVLDPKICHYDLIKDFSECCAVLGTCKCDISRGA